MAIRTVAIFSGCEMGMHFGRDPGQLPGKPVGHYGGRHQTALTTPPSALASFGCWAGKRRNRHHHGRFQKSKHS